MTHPLQEKIQGLLDTLVAEGKERGAQVAIYHEGKLIVDAWSGLASVRTGAPVDGDTLFPVFSTTKGVMATVVHVLAERGQLDYDTPIARYWPEFAANGKEKITLRHALTHTSGIPYMPVGITEGELYDWEAMCRQIANLRPVWPAGERFAYHPITFGWILGEVARRVDGRAPGRLVAQEIAQPLGLKTVFVGVPAELEQGVAFLEEMFYPPAQPITPGNPAEQGATPSMEPLSAWMNRSEARRGCFPGANGIMSARAVARHYAALLPGGVDRVALVPESRMRMALEPQPLPGAPGQTITERRGLGYGLGEGGMRDGFGHGGYGGSAGYGNLRHRLAVGVTRNRFSADVDLAGRVAEELRKEFEPA